MGINIIDGTIVIGVVVFLTVFTFIAKRYNSSVADFLAANRCAGRYLLCTAQGASKLGAITMIGYWQLYYNAGFSAQWWGYMMLPVGLVLSLVGWVTYRFRATRAMTIAQFFEMRYSRRFRIFCGILAWASGIINYGIFPAISKGVHCQLLL